MFQVRISKNKGFHVTAWCMNKDALLSLLENINDPYTFTLDLRDKPSFAKRYTRHIYASSPERLGTCCSLPFEPRTAS